MRKYGIMAATGLFFLSLAACKSTKTTSGKPGQLLTHMSVPRSTPTGNPVILHFTVYNPTKSELSFCKWHTPFEGFMSTFLDIKAANGQPADYRGAMAKRIMPPPPESYIKVPAKDSVSVDIDITRGYNLAAPGLYTGTYQGSGMSGLEKANTITFTISK